MDYRKMKELERRCNELIEETIGLLKEEGFIGAETVGLKVSFPAQEGVSSLGECPQSANDASPQGGLAARPPRVSQHKDCEKHGDAANVAFGKRS